MIVGITVYKHKETGMLHVRHVTGFVFVAFVGMGVTGSSFVVANPLYKCVSREGKTAFQDMPCPQHVVSESLGSDRLGERSSELARPASRTKVAVSQPSASVDEPKLIPVCPAPAYQERPFSLPEHQQHADMLFHLFEITKSHRWKMPEAAPAYGERKKAPNTCDPVNDKYAELHKEVESLSPHQYVAVKSCLIAYEQKLAKQKLALGCRGK